MKAPRPFQERRILAVQDCLDALGVQLDDADDTNPQVYWSKAVRLSIDDSAQAVAERINALITERGIRLTDGPTISASDEGIRITMAGGYPKFISAFTSTCAFEISLFLQEYIDEICADINIRQMTNTDYIGNRIRGVLIRERETLMSRENIAKLCTKDVVKNLRIAQFYKFSEPEMSNQDAVFGALLDGLDNPIKIAQYLHYVDRFLRPFDYEVDRAALFKAVERLLQTDFFGIFPVDKEDPSQVVNRKEEFDPFGSFLRAAQLNEIIAGMQSPECDHQKCPAMTPKVWKEWMNLMNTIMRKAEEPHQDYLNTLKNRIETDTNDVESWGQYAQAGCFIKGDSEGKLSLIEIGDACLQPFEHNPFLKALTAPQA